MKKIYTVLMMVVIAVILYGCSGGSSDFVGKVYVSKKGNVLYIIDKKYAKCNFDYEDKINTIKYEITNDNFEFDHITGRVVLPISNDGKRISGNIMLLDLDLTETDKTKLNPRIKKLLGL